MPSLEDKYFFHSLFHDQSMKLFWTVHHDIVYICILILHMLKKDNIQVIINSMFLCDQCRLVLIDFSLIS